jgi:hypothetical protein
MSQKCVESVIGRLATDEAFRSRFQADRAAALDALAAEGLDLTEVERRALLDLDCRACERFADELDPRIQKASFRRDR